MHAICFARSSLYIMLYAAVFGCILLHHAVSLAVVVNTSLYTMLDFRQYSAVLNLRVN
jgi:hypothetical protein